MIETNPPDFADYAALHTLLRVCFAGMEGRIDPPSSLMRMSTDDLRAKAARDDLFLIRAAGRPVGCLFGHPDGTAYYVDKLAVAASQKGRGHARALIEAATRRAADLGADSLRLQSRVELTENHAIFLRLGFREVGRSAHPGYEQPTSITFARPVPRAG